MIVMKRVYDAPAPDDGHRVLIDRLWPRGVSKQQASIDLWLKELAPSEELRRWFGHAAERFSEFAWRYRAELASPEAMSMLDDLIRRSQQRRVTLLYAARDDTGHNGSVLLGVLHEMRSTQNN